MASHIEHFRNGQFCSGTRISQSILPKVLEVVSESDHKFLIVPTKAKTARPGAFAYKHNLRGFSIKVVGKKRLILPNIDVHPFCFTHS
jgi:hypothetical protein